MLNGSELIYDCVSKEGLCPSVLGSEGHGVTSKQELGAGLPWSTWNTNQYAVKFAKQPESGKLPGDLATCKLTEQDEIPTNKSIRRLC